MRCLECERPVTLPGLLVAMEQREHFAMVRHAEICAVCAARMAPVFEEPGKKSLYWRQSMNCAYCNSKFPVARFRFDIPERFHHHLAVCEECYKKLRDDLMVLGPNCVAFIEKEWLNPYLKLTKRLPWANGVQVRVKRHAPRHAGQTGTVTSFRGLVQPWYGYTVDLGGGLNRFFHERDLELLETKTAAAGPPTPPAADKGPPPGSGDG